MSYRSAMALAMIALVAVYWVCDLICANLVRSHSGSSKV